MKTTSNWKQPDLEDRIRPKLTQPMLYLLWCVAPIIVQVNDHWSGFIELRSVISRAEKLVMSNEQKSFVSMSYISLHSLQVSEPQV